MVKVHSQAIQLSCFQIQLHFKSGTFDNFMSKKGGPNGGIMNNVTILVVDDESRMRKLIKDFFKQKNS